MARIATQAAKFPTVPHLRFQIAHTTRQRLLSWAEARVLSPPTNHAVAEDESSRDVSEPSRRVL